MRELDVATVPARVEQVIRNTLRFQPAECAKLSAPTHGLEIVTSQAVLSPLASVAADACGGADLLRAGGKPIRIKDKKVATGGTSWGACEALPPQPPQTTFGPGTETRIRA
jgi:hypothetical protein